MKFLTLFYLFGAPVLFTSMSLILSAVLLFENPSRDDTNYLLEFDLSKADFDEIYTFNPPLNSSLSYNDTRFTANVFRFGLWGYCNGTRTVNSAGLVEPNSFNGLECLSRKVRFSPDIQDILSSYASSQNETAVMTLQALSDGRNTRIFNSISAGFCLSILTTVFVFFRCPIFYFFPVISRFTDVASIVLSFVEWICFVIGMGTAKPMYEDLADHYTNDKWGTVATKGMRWFNIGWVTLSFSMLTFFSLIASLILQISLNKREAKRELPHQEQLREQELDESPPEYNKETEIKRELALQQQLHEQEFDESPPEYNKETEIYNGIYRTSGVSSTMVAGQFTAHTT
jgi:uncharacterized membrane protein